MKTLILFRHGKSDWENYTSDLERPVSDKGITKTIKIANYLKKYFSEERIIPEILYSSPAKRAFETANIISNVLNYNYTINNKLYTFDVNDVISFVKSIDDKYNSVGIFGHNPAYTEFVNKFGTQQIMNLSTSGVAILKFDILSWRSLVKGKTKNIILPNKIF